jgi:hypothetical protein
MSILRFEGNKILVKFAAGEVEATEPELVALVEMWGRSQVSKVDMNRVPSYYDDEGLTLFPELDDLD